MHTQTRAGRYWPRHSLAASHVSVVTTCLFVRLRTVEWVIELRRRLLTHVYDSSGLCELSLHAGVTV